MIFDTIAIQQKYRQIGAKRLNVLSASLSESEREVGESEGRGQRPHSLCVFCTVVILFKLFWIALIFILITILTQDKIIVKMVITPETLLTN